MEPFKARVGNIEFLVMTDRRYTDSDEWALLEDGRVRVGITDYAQKRLTDIVGVELPEVGDEVSKGDAIATLESMKATADVYAPVSGRIVEVNEDLYEEPELINKDPYGKGWIVVIEATDKGEYEELLGPEEYVESVKKRHH